jgi:hypothetical protein
MLEERASLFRHASSTNLVGGTSRPCARIRSKVHYLRFECGALHRLCCGMMCLACENYNKANLDYMPNSSVAVRAVACVQGLSC